MNVAGPLFMNISGTINDIIQTGLAFLIFDDVTPTLYVVVGLIISCVGEVYNSYGKYKEYNMKVGAGKVKME